MERAQERPLREFGSVFDDVAAAYDAVRPSYPGEIVQAACEAGALDGGSAVLEIGCGTGKLTELLVARDLRVRAVEPGANLVAAARKRIGQEGAVQFEVGRFEDADLPEDAYDAVFSATAFHWVDPRVGWAKAASLLKPGGLLALLTYIDIHDERSTALEHQFLDVVRAYAPAIARDWSHPRTHEFLIAGASERAGNASELWDWIMGEGMHAMAVPEAATLFDEVRLATVVSQGEQTPDELLAHLRTTSLWFMVEPARRQAFENENRQLIESHGGTFQFSRAAVLMTARRSVPHAPA
ncbi:MAG: class I SAM-dependent methyltransferase [Actinomycetota bacterium]|nr:class I SAM-dependent methyltransferase [Actinomycetota bacterium]